MGVEIVDTWDYSTSNTFHPKTHQGTPPTTPAIPHIPTTRADQPIRTDDQSCPRRNHNHSNDRPNRLLWNTGDQRMDHDPNPSERTMDLEPTPSSPTMCLDWPTSGALLYIDSDSLPYSISLFYFYFLALPNLFVIFNLPMSMCWSIHSFFTMRYREYSELNWNFHSLEHEQVSTTFTYIYISSLEPTL